MKRLFDRINSISVKVIIIYLALAIVNIAFFTSIVFENQVDLITENSRLQVEKIVSSIISSLKKFTNENRNSPLFNTNDGNGVIQQFDNLITPIVKDYVIFSEQGAIVKKSGNGEIIKSSYIQDGMKAVANQDFTGREYYVKIDEKNFRMNFYIPLKEYKFENAILYISYDIKNLNNIRHDLYAQVLYILIVTVVFHFAFALILFKIIIRPVHSLSEGSKKLAGGDLHHRVILDRKDEFGQLAQVFNLMVDSIQEKVETLEAKTEEMEVINVIVNESNKRLEDAKRIADRDMEMAINVQYRFFMSQSPSTNLWDTAFVFRPASGVSGDLYDFYLVDGELQGLSLFDVSGHGIASGLITMLAKAIVFRHFNDMQHAELHEIMMKINKELIDQINNVDNYLTGIILRLDNENNMIHYVNAGHPDLLMRKYKTGEVFSVGDEIEDYRGNFLGIEILARDYRQIKVEVESGDAVILYSDCFFDAMNNEHERFGMERIKAAIKGVHPAGSAKEMMDSIMNSFDNFVQDHRLSDDLTVIILKKK